MEKEKYDSIIIGFGKGGKTLAVELSKRGEKVAVIEKSDKMYGGTCINIGCIPTKYLITKGEDISKREYQSFDEYKESYQKIIQAKQEFISKLRQNNFNMLDSKENITIYTGKASFLSKKEIKIKTDTEEISIEGNKIFINTGADTLIPSIPGVNETNKIYTSTTIMELDKLPKKLAIIGGGYIGLEFANMYHNFGSQITIIETHKNILTREDDDIAQAVKEIMELKGIKFRLGFNIEEIIDSNDKVIIRGEREKIEADAILIATGRKANTKELELESIGIETNERGEIIVDEKLHTNIPNIWAIGDVKGGLQFTYISLDDYRIIKSELFGDKSYTQEKRKYVPYSVFIEPHLSRVGLNEKEALQKGYNIKVGKLEAKENPRANILGLPQGLLKVIVDAKTNKILGATLFSAMSAEVINIIRIAMIADLDYRIIRDNIFTHPTMSEALNDVFNKIPEE